MRAGLLSEPEVIKRINDTFVSTWILIDDAQKLAQNGNAFAETLASHWEFPMDLMFLSPEGKLIAKLNSFKDLSAAHSDVGHPPEGRGRDRPHLEVFNGVIEKHFGKD